MRCHRVVHAVILRFPTSAAVEAVVNAIPLAETGTFQSVPVKGLSIDGPVALEALPIASGSKHHCANVLQFSHGFEACHGKARPSAMSVIRIQKVPRIEKMPLAVVITEWM